MTKKDYAAIAAVVKGVRHSENVRDSKAARMGLYCVALGLADVCADDNDHFDEDLFLHACGVER